jgi:hypothetical protein
VGTVDLARPGAAQRAPATRLSVWAEWPMFEESRAFLHVRP